MCDWKVVGLIPVAKLLHSNLGQVHTPFLWLSLQRGEVEPVSHGDNGDFYLPIRDLRIGNFRSN